jgi:3-phenylpropionate/trans-cinnamate dioxygenase ferredoxin subunit
MEYKNYRWQKIAEHINELLPGEGNLGVFEYKGKKLTIGKTGELVFACAYKCPHAGGILSEGFMDALGNIVCPLHRYKFNPLNGHNISGEGYYLKHFPVELRADGVWMGVVM